MREAVRDPIAWLRAGIVVAAGVAYGLAAAPFVLGGDAGELATLFATGGIAHPPGYPTEVLWLRALHWIPCKTPAHGAALATALAATLAVWSLQRACRAWGASGGVTALVSALFAFSPCAWNLGSEAEVFALSALLAGIILTLSAPEPSLRGAQLTAALGALAGLGLGNQQTIVLLAPLGLVAVVRGVRRAPRPWWALAAGGLGLAVGLLGPYGYDYFLCRTADRATVPMWIEAPSLAGVWSHFLRSAYGTLSLAAPSVGGAVHPTSSLVLFAARTCSDLQGLPLVLLGALVLLVRRRWPRAPWPVGALVLSALLAGPGFTALSNIPLDGLGAAVIRRFDLLPELLFSLLAAMTLQALLAGVALRPLLQVCGCVALTVVAAVRAWPAVAQAHRPDVEHYKDNVLATLPERAILVTSGDAEWGAFLYSRYAEHRRPDVTVVDSPLLRQAWYRQELKDLRHLSLEAGSGKQVDAKTLLRRLVATGRPVFFTRWPESSLNATPHDSFGPLMRAWPDGAERPGLDALLEANRGLFASYALDLPAPADRAAWGHLLYERYARGWRELSGRFAEAGRPQEASECAGWAAKLTPWMGAPVARAH